MLCSRHLSSREKNCIVMLGYVLMDKSPNSDVLGKTKQNCNKCLLEPLLWLRSILSVITTCTTWPKSSP